MHRNRALFVVAIALAPSAAWPQGSPIGPEFRVNTYTTAAQWHADIAADPAGNFVVVWDGTGGGDATSGIFGQRFASSGAALGPEFRVNTVTTDAQSAPSVAADSAGNFVVAWSSSGGYGGAPSDVYAQRYASGGAPLGPEFRVNTFTPSSQNFVTTAAAPAGGFVVVWTSAGQDGSSVGVFGQRFASSGAPVGPEFRVNTFTTDNQYSPSAAFDSAGNFVVAWVSKVGYGGAPDVFGQRYTSGGTPLGLEFRINTFTTGVQTRPTIAAEPAGSFVVVWYGSGQGESNTGVFAQRFASSGIALGPEFRVNTSTTELQYLPSVAADSAGGFVVAWNSSGGYGGGAPDVFGQRYASDGTALGPEFRINTFAPGFQTRAALTAHPAGFVVTWDSYGQDGSATAVFAQRFGPIVPVELLDLTVE